MAPAFIDGIEAANLAAMGWGARRAAEDLGLVHAGEAIPTYTPPRAPRLDDVPHRFDSRGRAIADLAGTPFAVRFPEAERAASRRAAELVRGVDDVTRDRLRRLVTDARERGQSGERLGRRIAGEFPYMAVGRPQHHIDSRAHMIAVTETAFAYERGQRMIVDQSAAAGLVMVKSWLTVGDGHVDGRCSDNEAQGEIPYDESFVSLDEEPPAHPGCRCTSQYRALSSEERRARGDEPEPPLDPARVPFDDVLGYMERGGRSAFEDVLTRRYGVERVTYEGNAASLWGRTSQHVSLARAFERYRVKGQTGLARSVEFRTTPLGKTQAGGDAAANFSFETRHMNVGPQPVRYAGEYRYGYPGQRATIRVRTDRPADAGGLFDVEKVRAADAMDDLEALIVHELGHGIEARFVASVRGKMGDIHRATGASLDDLTAQLSRAKSFREESAALLDRYRSGTITPRAGAREMHEELLVRYDRQIEALRAEMDRIAKASRSAGTFVSEYAKTNQYEDLAESVTWYLADPEDLRRTSLARYRLVARIFGDPTR